MDWSIYLEYDCTYKIQNFIDITVQSSPVDGVLWFMIDDCIDHREYVHGHYCTRMGNGITMYWDSAVITVAKLPLISQTYLKIFKCVFVSIIILSENFNCPWICIFFFVDLIEYWQSIERFYRHKVPDFLL